MKDLLRMMLLLCVTMFNTQAIAYIEPTDNILNDEENAIYIIGWIYSRVTSSPREPGSNNIVYKIDLKDNSKAVFYDAGSATIDRLTLSPNKQYISVLKGYSGWFGSVSELSIIDIKETREIDAFKDEIGKYKWNPNGDKIVYITGGDVEGRGFRSKGVFVHEIGKKEKKKIANKAKDVEWLPNDNIYVIDHSMKQKKDDDLDKIKYGTLVYSYKDGVIKDKGVKGVKFSLDGKYSILLTPQYGDITADEKSIRINFYDMKLNGVISVDRLNNIFSEPSRIEWDSFTWVKGNRIVFEKGILNSLVRDILVCDIENNRVLKSLKGKMVGVNSDRSKIVLFKEGKFEAVAVP